MENKSKEVVILADAQSRIRAIEVAGHTLNVLLQVRSNIKAAVEKANFVEEYKDFFVELDKLCDQARYLENLSLDEIWLGLTDKLEEKIKCTVDYQYFLATKQFQKIDEDIDLQHRVNIIMVYDINEKAEFLRGYMLSTGKIEPVSGPEKQM